MGNKQQTGHQNQLILNYDRLSIVQPHQDAPVQKQCQIEMGDMLSLQKFKSNFIGNEYYQDFQISFTDKNVIITKQFQDISDLEKCISNIIKVSRMLNIILYDELKFFTNQEPYNSVITLEIKQFKQVSCDFVKQASLEQKMDLLQFICPFLNKVKNMFICPHFIASSSKGSYYLLNFSYTKQFTPQEMFLGFLRWVFGSDKQFEVCLQLDETPANMPIYLQQIYQSMFQHKSLTIRQLQFQIKMIKDKMSFLMNKTDSFYACQFFNKTQKHAAKSDWINMKFKHEIFFYHTKDEHSFVGKLIRKKKKKDITECCITFDHEDLQVLYVPENSKNVVKVSEFQFQSSSSISDLQIKYKLPVKFKNCLITRARNGDLFILEQYLHRFQCSNNKLIQETKKISDYIYLTSLRDSSAFIVKLSIDIFRNGIRVFYKNEDLILAHAGDKQKLESISTIRIDIRHVVFCIEIYKGVFLMMASKNMWVLDLNFQCFFSFATPTQIKKLTASLSKHQSNEPSSSQNVNHDHLFLTLNQPFKVEYPCQNGNNALIKNNYLHILGMIQGHPYYLRYSFISRMGAIKLEGYHPLYVQSPFMPIKLTNQPIQFQEYTFNFHEENSHLYKYGNWIFTGKLFVKVYDFNVKFEKSNYQVKLRTEKLGECLKTHIERMFTPASSIEHKLGTSLRYSKMLLLYKIFSIYEYLFANSINHRNISISHIVFSQSKELKIHGWSQPPRNWHVSDYKDYLLVCFNVITCSTYEKMSDKIISKHETELNNFPVFGEKILQAFRQFKTIQKRPEIEKNLQVFKSYLQKQLTVLLNSVSSSRFILCPEFRTPRLSVLSLESSKLKKITIVQQENSNQQFTFEETDKYVWNQAGEKLYIFKAAHQFFEIKIKMANGIVEEKQTLEDYEYLPMNIGLCSFVGTKNDGLYSFGGIKKQADGKSTYNYKIFKFNWKMLTWEAIGDLPEPCIDPHTVVSACGRFIYLLGGHRCLQFCHLQLIKFDTLTNACVLLEDYASKAVSTHQSSLSPMRIFHICDQPLLIFMFWYIQQNDYVIKYVTYSSIGFQIELRAKNFSNDNVIIQDAVALDSNTIHLLRLYGKYTKIAVNKLENLSVKNETVYAIA